MLHDLFSEIARLVDQRDASVLIAFASVGLQTVAIAISAATARHLKYFLMRTRGSKGLSIIGVMVRQRGRSSRLGYIALASMTVVYSVVSFAMGWQLEAGVFVLISLVCAVLFAREQLFLERVRSGSYGGNEEEAREIVRFVLENRSHIDFTDGGKPKRIISQSDLTDILDSPQSIAKPA